MVASTLTPARRDTEGALADLADRRRQTRAAQRDRCPACGRQLPAVPPPVDPRRWRKAPWPARHARRHQVTVLVRELAAHAAGRCQWADSLPRGPR